jgi:hypothetical protein
MGEVDPNTLNLTLTKPCPPLAVKAFAFAMLVIDNQLPASLYPKAKIMHAGKCCKCRRTLTTPQSLMNGIGPECQKVLV